MVRSEKTEKMRKWYDNHKKTFWCVVIVGIPIGYFGIWFDLPWLMWSGIALALPLFVVVLPFCVFLLTVVLTRPFWWPFWYPLYRLILKRNGVTYAALFGSFVRKVSPGSNPNGQS